MIHPLRSAALIVAVISMASLPSSAGASSAVPSSISPVVEVLVTGRGDSAIPFAGVRLGWQTSPRTEFTLDLTTVILLSNALAGIRVDVSPARPHPYLYARAGFIGITYPGIFDQNDLEPSLRLDAGGGLNVIKGRRTAWFIEAGGVTIGRQTGTGVIFRAATGVRFGL